MLAGVHQMTWRNAHPDQHVEPRPFLPEARAQVAGGEHIAVNGGGGFGDSGDVARERTRGRQGEGDSCGAHRDHAGGSAGSGKVRCAGASPWISPEPRTTTMRLRRVEDSRRRLRAGVGGGGSRAAPGHGGVARGAWWPRRRQRVLRRRLG